MALLAGVLAATTGFTVLTAGVQVQRLRVDGAVAENYRPAYDILVRPGGARTGLESRDNLVAPNHLSGVYGGITAAQAAQVSAIPHVRTAAPIAMLGYTSMALEQTVDLTGQVDPARERQLFRLSPKWVGDRGLTVLDDAPQYVYVTRNAVIPGMPDPGTYRDGSTTPGLPGCATDLEVLPDGTRQRICAARPFAADVDGTTDLERTVLHVRTRTADGRYVQPTQYGQPRTTDRLTVTVHWPVMVLVAAVDPEQEADLVGLDRAVVSGRYLTAADRAVERREAGLPPTPVIPAVVADTPYVDETLTVEVERMAGQEDRLADTRWEDWVPALADAVGTPAGPPTRSPGPPRFTGADDQAWLGLLYRPGPVDYRDENGVLRPAEVPSPEGIWRVDDDAPGVWADRPPRAAMADGFRDLDRIGDIAGVAPVIGSVGAFDPGRLRGFSALSQVPMETYRAPEAVGADARSRRLLGDRPLLPGNNPAGYLATPPLALVNIASLADVPALSYEKDPISAIRVRVAGVTGVDERSQELVRTTAERIAVTTGLDVDIVIGSSPVPKTVALPAADGGRPALTLTEHWSRKGVAVAVVQAADRKSVALFLLILVVCTLFLGNGVAAAVRDRRRELAVLACLGWSARRLAGVVFSEVLAVGLVAGALAVAAVLPLSSALDVSVSAGHALLALPAGLAVALFASVPAVASAARARPGAALRPAVLGVRRAKRGRGVLGMALSNLWRVPGRTALGVSALAVGVAALTVLAVIAVVFRNDVIGSLLGDAVALRVRSVDVFAAVTVIGLGVLMVADVLYVNVRERSAELAALWASGWPDRALLRLVVYEGLGMGVLGAALGAVAGLAGVLWFAGSVSVAMVWPALAVASGAVVVAGLAAVVPALVLRGLSLSTVLAEEG